MCFLWQQTWHLMLKLRQNMLSRAWRIGYATPDDTYVSYVTFGVNNLIEEVC